MTTPLIRQAVAGDRDALADLWLRFLEEQSGLDAVFRPSDDALVRWRNDYPGWLHDAGRRLLVAEGEGVIVGFVAAQRWAPPPVYAPALEVHLDELYVDPSWRGCGLGGRLVEAVRAWALELGAERIRLSMLAANDAGARFWERQGARPFSRTHLIDLAPAAPRAEKRRLGFL